MRDRVLDAVDERRITYTRAGRFTYYRLHFPADGDLEAVDRSATAQERRVLGSLASAGIVWHAHHRRSGLGLVRRASTPSR
jgi:hypothetical protein